MSVAQVINTNALSQGISKGVISSEIVKFLEKCYSKKDFQVSNPYYVAISLDKSGEKPFQYMFKRLIEIVGTLFGMAVLMPVFLTIAVAIKIDSKGPIFFKQKRIGRHGKEFYMYKFRSMKIDAEEQLEELKEFNQTNELMFKMYDDPRITKLGKFLRKYSIDEFPQLINVLKGEMSLVGFRPPLPSEVEKYQRWHFVRFASMPGLTGPWQVSGRSAIKSFDQVINLEYEYSKDWSLRKDLEILFRTIPVVLFGKDAA